MKLASKLIPIAALLVFVALIAIGISIVSASGDGRHANQIQPTPSRTPSYIPPTLTPTPTSPDNFRFCANEGSTCQAYPANYTPTTSPLRPRVVRFGANGQHAYATIAAHSIPCSYTIFGDPIPGVNKNCYQAGAPLASHISWTTCATESGTCSFSGAMVVRYGANGVYNYKTATDSILCSHTLFGDPLVGVYKICQYMPPPSATTVLAYKWIGCAQDGGTCTMSLSAVGSNPTRTIAYGANGTFYYKTITGPFYCWPSSFDGVDPVPNVVKTCYYADVDQDIYGWVRCAGENGACSFVDGPKTVAYGASTSFFYRTATGSIACNNATFGDPISGTVKACYYSTKNGY